MKKSSTIILALLFVLCLTLSISSISMSAKVTDNECDTYIDTDLDSFDSLKYLDSFDVSDFSGKEINTIDIASLKYPNNTVAISNSDFMISDELLTELYNIINEYGASSSFYIVSLEDGMTIAYNIDKKYETASSIKAPYALYIYKEIAKGNINPKQKIEYKEKYFNPGTGVVKKSEFGTEFTVEDLLYYSLFESDNIAHEMLHGTFGVKGYNEMLKNIGTKELYLTLASAWGYTSARSAALIWQDIYNFSITNSEGIELLNILSTAKYNYFKEIRPEIQSAGKAGFASRDVLETGIVFDNHPYIAIAMANRGGKTGAYTQVIKLIRTMDKIMQEYDTYLKGN